MNNFSEIISLINKAEKIAVLNHVNMDGDAVGSAFSLASAISSLGKNVVVLLDEAPPPYLEFACDSYLTADDVADEVFDLAIAVDSGDLARLGKRAGIFNSAKAKICIDHHVSNVGFGDVNCIKPEASSTAEIIYELILKLTGTVTKRQAEQLYAGIITDTGGFKFSNTTKESFIYSADLLEKGADINDVCISIYESESIEKLKIKARVLNSLKLYGGGKVSGAIITEKDFLETGATVSDCEGFSGIGRSIAGVEASFSIIVKDQVKVSLRSKRYVDVSKVAAFFGGGGHIRASGFTLPIDTDIEALLEKLTGLLIREVEAG